MTVSKMGGGRADYYERWMFEQYYLDRECSWLEPRGRWRGQGAAACGLAGQEVERAAFGWLFAGFSPDGRQRWVSNAGRQTGTERDRMPGYDLTLAPPKSVSICWALGGAETRQRLIAAHEAALAATVQALEQLAEIRSGGGGRRREAAGLIIGVFQHSTARQTEAQELPDMQLHSHLCVINTGIAASGRRGALNGLDFLNDEFALTYGAVYRAALATQLERAGWALVRTADSFEIAGLERPVIAEFSRREQQIRAGVKERLGKERKEATAKEKLAVNHATRLRKQHGYDPQQLLESWRRRAAVYGVDEQYIESLRLTRRAGGPEAAQVAQESPTAELRQHIQTIVEAAPSLDARSLAREQAHLSTPTERQEPDLQQRAREWLDADARQQAREPQEQELRRRAREWLGVDEQQTANAWQEANEQRGAIATRFTRRRRAARVSRAEWRAHQQERLSELRAEWEERGYKVIGCAFSRQRTADLQEAGYQQAHTVARLLADQRPASFWRKVERVQRAAYANFMYFTHRWSAAAKKKYLGEYWRPGSRLYHEFLYATHQISKGQRDYLNRALDRQARALDARTVLIVNEREEARAQADLQELIAAVERRGGQVIFAGRARLQSIATTSGRRRPPKEQEEQPQQQRQQQRRLL